MANVDASGNFDPDEPGSAPHQAAEDEIEFVEVYPPEGKLVETAQALLDAAESERDVVYSGDHFYVPADVASKAKLGKATTQPADDVPNVVRQARTLPAADESKSSARKSTARKSPAKKATARKSSAK